MILESIFAKWAYLPSGSTAYRIQFSAIFHTFREQPCQGEPQPSSTVFSITFRQSRSRTASGKANQIYSPPLPLPETLNFEKAAPGTKNCSSPRATVSTKLRSPAAPAPYDKHHYKVSKIFVPSKKSATRWLFAHHVAPILTAIITFSEAPFCPATQSFDPS